MSNIAEIKGNCMYLNTLLHSVDHQSMFWIPHLGCNSIKTNKPVLEMCLH